MYVCDFECLKILKWCIDPYLIPLPHKIEGNNQIQPISKDHSDVMWFHLTCSFMTFLGEEGSTTHGPQAKGGQWNSQARQNLINGSRAQWRQKINYLLLFGGRGSRFSMRIYFETKIVMLEINLIQIWTIRPYKDIKTLLFSNLWMMYWIVIIVNCCNINFEMYWETVIMQYI